MRNILSYGQSMIKCKWKGNCEQKCKCYVLKESEIIIIKIIERHEKGKLSRRSLTFIFREYNFVINKPDVKILLFFYIFMLYNFVFTIVLLIYISNIIPCLSPLCKPLTLSPSPLPLRGCSPIHSPTPQSPLQDLSSLGQQPSTVPSTSPPIDVRYGSPLWHM